MTNIHSFKYSGLANEKVSSDLLTLWIQNQALIRVFLAVNRHRRHRVRCQDHRPEEGCFTSGCPPRIRLLHHPPPLRRPPCGWYHREARQARLPSRLESRECPRSLFVALCVQAYPPCFAPSPNFSRIPFVSATPLCPSPLELHHLEPAGPPQGNTKVGCGHDVQDYEVWLETDQTSAGYVPCRYRVPFDARRGLPDSLALTFLPPSSHCCVPFRSFLFMYLFAYMSADHTGLLGCPRARLCHHRVEEGKEARASEEGSRQEGQDRVERSRRCCFVVCDDHTVFFAFHSHRTHPCICLCSSHDQAIICRLRPRTLTLTLKTPQSHLQLDCNDAKS